MQKEIFETDSAAATAQFAANLAKKTKPGTVIALHGELGAGKTVFARGFARGLKIREPVTSPTFTIVQEYQLKAGGPAERLYHLDLYRIPDSGSALVFGVDEFLHDPGAYALVEWPERIDDLLPPNTVRILIEHLSENRRKLTLSR